MVTPFSGSVDGNESGRFLGRALDRSSSEPSSSAERNRLPGSLDGREACSAHSSFRGLCTILACGVLELGPSYPP